MKKTGAWISFSVLSLAIIAAIWFFNEERLPQNQLITEQPVKAIEVLAGNKILISNHRVMLLAGVETPKKDYPEWNRRMVDRYNLDRNAYENYIDESRKYLTDLVMNKSLRIEYDSDLENPDELYGYVYVEGGEESINAMMLKMGMGHALATRPTPRLNELKKYEKNARENQKGIWAHILTSEKYEADSGDIVDIKRKDDGEISEIEIRGVTRSDPFSENIFLGFPSDDCVLLKRSAYVACYDENEKVADWVSYKLRDSDLLGDTSRTDDFRPDPEISAGKRSELVDYRGSGYDRGHLAPAGDMKRSQKVMSESFLLTNMAPQTPSLNRGIWRVLEEDIRDWVRTRNVLYVMTGPLYLDTDGDGRSDETHIGPNKVAVPTHFFKIVVTEQLESIAFIFPNDKELSQDLTAYISTINEIEVLSGLDFLRDLDDEIEERIEAQKSELW